MSRAIIRRVAFWRRGLWRNPDFLKFWGAQATSQFGSMVGGPALSFTAILVLQASPFELAMLSLAREAPAFVAAVFAGAWVDRLPRRPLLIATDLGRALVLASIPVAALAGTLHIGQLYAVALATSVLTLFFDVAYQAYLPSLVSRDALVEGNSKLSASASVAEVSGFGLAGWLVQWFTAPLAIAIDAASFLCSAAVLGAIRMPEPPRAASLHMAPDLRREIADGVRLVWAHPALRALAGTVMLVDLAQSVIGTVIVLYMSRGLGFGPGVLGTIWAIGGLTSLGGALLAGPVTRGLGAGPAMVLGLLGSSLGTLTVPLAQGNGVRSMALLTVNQIVTDPAHTIYAINEVSLRQSMVPDHVLGRVAATMRFAGVGATLLGAALGGMLGEIIGVRWTLVAGCGLTLLGTVWLATSPAGRIRTHAPPPLDPDR